MYQEFIFSKGTGDQELETGYKMKVENTFFRHRLALTADEEKLSAIVASGIFGKYHIIDLLVNSNENTVCLRNADGAFGDYVPKIYPSGALVNPWIETALEKLRYVVGKDVHSCSGDYYFDKQAIERVTVGDLREIRCLGGVLNIEIRIGELDEPRQEHHLEK